jgi:hypothetical protein
MKYCMQNSIKLVRLPMEMVLTEEVVLDVIEECGLPDKDTGI